MKTVKYFKTSALLLSATTWHPQPGAKDTEKVGHILQGGQGVLLEIGILQGLFWGDSLSWVHSEEFLKLGIDNTRKSCLQVSFDFYITV